MLGRARGLRDTCGLRSVRLTLEGHGVQDRNPNDGRDAKGEATIMPALSPKRKLYADEQSFQ
jgi:hypothetical protein